MALLPVAHQGIDFASPVARRMAEVLKRAKLLPTPARVLILVFLNESPVPGHSAVGVVSGLFDRGVHSSAGTIKQNISLLQRHGLLDLARNGRSSGVYSLRRDLVA